MYHNKSFPWYSVYKFQQLTWKLLSLFWCTGRGWCFSLYVWRDNPSQRKTEKEKLGSWEEGSREELEKGSRKVGGHRNWKSRTDSKMKRGKLKSFTKCFLRFWNSCLYLELKFLTIDLSSERCTFSWFYLNFI